MTRWMIAAVAGCTLAACGSSPAASGQPGTTSATVTAATARCGPAGARTLAASSRARVYVRGGTVYACAGGRRFVLGRTGSCIHADQVGRVVVAAQLAAYADMRCGVDTGSTVIVVRRLSDGASLFTSAAATVALPESYTTVTDLVLSPDGRAAWIARTSSIVQHRGQTSVWVHRGTSARELASGAAIVTGSLRRQGATIAWMQGHVRHTAPL